MKSVFARLSPSEQEKRVLTYARDRFLNTEAGGGLEDPFITPLHIRRKFGADAWGAVERLLAQKELIDASEDKNIQQVIHRRGVRIPEMRALNAHAAKRAAETLSVTRIDDKTTDAEFKHAVRAYADSVLEIAEKHHGPFADPFDLEEEP